MNIRSVTFRAEAASQSLLIALPGLHVRPEDFAREGLVPALQARAPIDVIVPELGPDDYFQPDFGPRLEAGAIAPARQAGYRRIAILALSLGAFGALRFAMRFAGALDGLILLAPFLANPGTIAEIADAGGLMRWSPGPLDPSDIERPGLLWLKSHLSAFPARPQLWLGYGDADRFRAGAALLGAALAPCRVTVVPGGHDWDCWRALWQAMLARPLLAENLLG